MKFKDQEFDALANLVGIANLKTAVSDKICDPFWENDHNAKLVIFLLLQINLVASFWCTYKTWGGKISLRSQLLTYHCYARLLAHLSGGKVKMARRSMAQICSIFSRHNSDDGREPLS